MGTLGELLTRAELMSSLDTVLSGMISRPVFGEGRRYAHVQWIEFHRKEGRMRADPAL